jgi:5S rRNA maturation endonuclease (ribonuclease M5)
MRTVETLGEAIEAAKHREQTMVRCPAHDDGAASLHVTYGDKHPVLMTCHAGCTLESILHYGGIDAQQLLAPKDENAVGGEGEWTPAGPASHVYDYVSAEGELLFQVLRVPIAGGKKTFRQRHPIPGPKPWAWNMDGVERVLYHLPEVLEAKAKGEVIYVVEGEKDADNLRSRCGVTATTSPMGAGKWQESYTETLAGANVVIISDADATGRNHSRAVRTALLEAGCSVAMKEAANGQKDVTDHLNSGGTLETLIETSPADGDKKVSYGIDILSVIKRVVQPSSFVIPGTLARGDRLLLTGFEGHGKSTLSRQIAVMVAAGIHPWTHMPIPPQKVMFIDSENHPDQVLESWQQLVGLAAAHGHQIQEGMLTIIEAWDDDIDLTSDEGHAWMIERIHAHKPDLCGAGPLYNLSSRDLSEHAVVGKMKQVINEARSLYGTAFILEHHAPHRGTGEKERSVRPYGSSTFLKWPDFGYGLRPISGEQFSDDFGHGPNGAGLYEWQKTRFPRVRTRKFPTHLRWGKANTDEFPWMPCEIDEASGLVLG